MNQNHFLEIVLYRKEHHEIRNHSQTSQPLNSLSLLRGSTNKQTNDQTMSMLSSRERLTRSVSFSKVLKFGILFGIMFLAFFKELETVPNHRNNNCHDAKTITNKPPKGTTTGTNNIVVVATNAIAPGELPGYTGWARPEKTLARSFSIVKSVSSTGGVAVTPEAGDDKETFKMSGTRGYHESVITVKCEGHKDCVVKTRNRENNNNSDDDNGPSLFFLRAYGPAVVPGTVTSRSCRRSVGVDEGCYYDISFVFYDPGLYTIEVVLTFSSPPPISAFPLSTESNQQEPHYEGYLLPGFPLVATVEFEQEEGETTNPQKSKSTTSSSDNNTEEKDLCKFEDLVETSSTSAMKKARWKVTGKVNEKEYSSKTMNSPLVSTMGYIHNVNSLGINMEYRYVNDCLILPESSFDKNRRDGPTSVGQCSGPRKKIHIVYIGDSVLRVQKDMLQDLLKGIPTHQVEFTYLSLYGGYRKNQVLGPASVETFLQDLRVKTNDENVVILFNTGLHDIHRLCGAEFLEERPTYLEKDRLVSGSFACVDEYRALLKDFINAIHGFPAALKVFQSTTAAWPKYGNYGIGWDKNAQDMPLVSDFSAAFNEVAFEVLADYKDTTSTGSNNIDIMDGYWITYSRPDNREVGDIGKKLSHPGAEVLSAMARTWVMLISDKVCLPI
jgi:hypothetical protein